MSGRQRAPETTMAQPVDIVEATQAPGASSAAKNTIGKGITISASLEFSRRPGQIPNLASALQAIQKDFGEDWIAYRNALMAFVRCHVQGRDTRHWFVAVQGFVQDRPDRQFIHQGVLFYLDQLLLKENPNIFQIRKIDSNPGYLTDSFPHLDAGAFNGAQPPASEATPRTDDQTALIRSHFSDQDDKEWWCLFINDEMQDQTSPEGWENRYKNPS